MNEARPPKVSVCIPTHNGGKYLPGAIASVVEQTFADYEIVIVDNASSDDTEAVVRTLCEHYSQNFRYFRNPSNLGLAGNLNRCVAHARGEYIKLLCVDDLLLPESLGVLVTALDKYPSVMLVTGRRIMINKDGRLLDTRSYGIKDSLVNGIEAITRCLFRGNLLGEPSAVMFRKCDFLRLGCGFKEALPQLMDMELWFRLLEAGDLFNIGRPICAIRVHDAQMTWANVKSGALVRDNMKVFDEYARKSYINPRFYQYFQQRLIMTYRIWYCRDSFDDDELRAILASHAYPFAYFFMPLASFVASVAAKLR